MSDFIGEIIPKGDNFEHGGTTNYSENDEIYLMITRICGQNITENTISELSGIRLQPGSTNISIQFNTNITNFTGYYLRVATDMDSYNYALVGTTGNTINITLPSSVNYQLCSKNNTLVFYGIARTTNAVYELPGGYTGDTPKNAIDGKITINNIYAPPVIYNIIENNLEKCNENYNFTTDGNYIYVSNLKLSLQSGVIEQYGALRIKNTNIELLSQNNSNTIMKKIFGSGYSDSSTSHLFPINNNIHNYIENNKITLQFEYKPKLFTDNADFSTFSVDLSIANSYQVLTLIGETTITRLGQNKTVYGGIAIGQDSTIQEKGEPIFECKYPAYFNGIRFGYYPGNEILSFYSDVTFSGVNNGNKINFSIFLGQPIYATDVELSGNIKIYGILNEDPYEYHTVYNNNGQYITSSTMSNRGYYQSTYSVSASKITLTNINQQCGIISFQCVNYDLAAGPVAIVPFSYFGIKFK